MKKKEYLLWRAIQSVLAACFGVQSEKNMQRDLKQKDPFAYILMGIIFVVFFVLALRQVVLYLAQ